MFVPPSVKHIAYQNNKSVLQLQLIFGLSNKLIKDKPIEQKHYWEKQSKLERIKRHRLNTVALCLNKAHLTTLFSRTPDNGPKGCAECKYRMKSVEARRRL